ncbi:MAG: lysine decarboxylase [Synechococcaceae cyanobacterium]
MADPEPPSPRLLDLLAAPPPPLPLHLPAHGRGRGLPPALRLLLRRRPGSWDLPELPAIGGPLEAEGAVAAAQARAAALLGADRCWFGVNGASGLLQVALLALAAPGERVLLPRNLHRSLLHGCVLGGLEPVLFDGPSDPRTGIRLPPTAAHLDRVLAACGPVAALVLVDPTYHGLSAPLAPLVALAHGRGLPVLVDQAHGRGDALAAGADLVVLSPQKAGAGLAQAALLLARGPRVDGAAVERALLWLQTSSPSALLLASAAAAIDWQCSPAGARQRRRALGRAQALRAELDRRDLPLLATADPLRLTLATAALGITGPQADAWLLPQGVIAELPEPGALTFCLGLQPPAGLERRLPRQLAALRRALGGPPLPPFAAPPLPLVAAPELALARAWRAPCQLLPLAQAAGRLVARPVCPYPPGIPLLVPGERLDGERLAWLERQRCLWPDQVADTVAVVA